MGRRRNKSRDLDKAVFADTVFWIALLTRRDQYHARAVQWKRWLDSQKAQVITTEAVLWEWLNASSALALRVRAAKGYRLCHQGDEVQVVPFQSRQVQTAFTLYEARADKCWSLTDCLSFVVMEERQLTDALTADRHFEPAGFRALLLGDPPS